MYFGSSASSLIRRPPNPITRFDLISWIGNITRLRNPS